MNGINEFHDKAMELAEEADRAKRRGNLDEAQTLYHRALELEKVAAFNTPLKIEPTRSILYRSAATLALDCHSEQDAKRLATAGLAGNPPADIADELHAIIAQIRERELSR